MTSKRFDLQRLHHAIDTERQHHGLSWSALARQVGVSASTIRRFNDADDAEADGVLALVRWLGACPEDYVDGASKAEPLPPPGYGFIRIDPEPAFRALDQTRGAAQRTRMSIQQLTTAAERADTSIASLTRLSQT